MSLRDHAIKELELLGYKLTPGQAPGPDKWIPEAVLELIETFAKQGHSGSSAPYVADVFHKLARYEPLTPLTGKDDEWMEVGPGVFQNKRCSHIFKEGGKAYDIQGIVFEDQFGGHYTNRDSRLPVIFPCNPPKPSFLRRNVEAPGQA